MTKTTHIQRIRQENASIKTQVLNLLGWDELKFGEFQQDAAFAYLQDMFGDLELGADLPNHKAFWAWWILHWAKRDREFLEMSGLLFSHELAGYYRDLHDPTSIPFQPHGVIMEETYSAMIHKLVKEVVGE